MPIAIVKYSGSSAGKNPGGISMFAEVNKKKQDRGNIRMPNWQIFLFITGFNMLIALCVQKFIYSGEFYYSLLSDQMEISRIDDMINVMSKYSFMGLVLLPVFIFFRFLITSLLLQLTLLLKFIDLKFTGLFRLVMFSSLAISAGQVIYFIRLHFFPTKELNRALLLSQPFSLAGLINTSDYPQSTILVLNHCGLFEFLWMGCIFWGLMKTNRLKKEDATAIVLILWSGMLFLTWGFSFYIEKFQ